MHISYKPLWHTLLERDMRKEDLRLAAGMTTNMIANMSKEGKHISMDTLARICETLNCVQIIKAYLNETADLIAEKDLQIHLDILPSAFINGNKMLVEKVFSNLIGNAIKYSPQRADIWISVLMKHEQIVFSVENAGVHIPENSIPRLFDAFYRVEQSRSRKTGGSGLGLYIVQEILHQYGSECTVCNTQAGVKFSFII